MAKYAKQVNAYIGLSVMTAIIGLSFIFVKIGLRYTTPIDLLAHRFSAAFFMLMLLWLFKAIEIPKINIKKSKELLLISLFYPILFFFFQTYGMKYTSASEAGIIFSTTPIITLIAASIFLKEKTVLLQKVGVALSVIGVAYIIYQKGGFFENPTNLQGILILLLSVCSLVVYYIIGKKISSKFSALHITIWMTVIAFVVFNAWSIFSHLRKGALEKFFEPFAQLEFIGAMLYLGILSSVLTSFLSNFALPLIPAAQIVVFNNLSPIIAVAGGILFLDEKLYAYHIIGGILVVAGILITLIFKYKDKIQTQNIHNLTELWKLAGVNMNSYAESDEIKIVENPISQWPNRIWTNQPVSQKIIRSVLWQMEKNPHLIFAHFNTEKKKNPLIISAALNLKSVQYGMHLSLGKRFLETKPIYLKRVTTEAEAQTWSEAFHNSFRYQIAVETVLKTKNTVRYYTVYSNSELMGTVVLFITDKVAGIHSLGVIPGKRGQRFATEIMYRILNKSIDLNLQVATLQASEMAKEMYVKIGFTNDFIMENYQLKNN